MASNDSSCNKIQQDCYPRDRIFRPRWFVGNNIKSLWSFAHVIRRDHVNRARKRRSRSENMQNMRLFYSQVNKIVWLSNMADTILTNSRGAQRYVGFLFLGCWLAGLAANSVHVDKNGAENANTNDSQTISSKNKCWKASARIEHGSRTKGLPSSGQWILRISLYCWFSISFSEFGHHLFCLWFSFLQQEN